MDDEPPDEHSDHDYVGPALGRQMAPAWTEKNPKQKEPPRVKYVMQSETGDRYILSTGSHVLHSNFTNKWTCLFSQCVNGRKANLCQHVDIAQSYARDHAINPEIVVGSDPEQHPFAAEQSDSPAA